MLNSSRAACCTTAIVGMLLAVTVSGCGSDSTSQSSDEVMQETIDIPSKAQPADTPGSPGVTVTSPKLLTQFGNANFSNP